MGNFSPSHFPWILPWILLWWYKKGLWHSFYVIEVCSMRQIMPTTCQRWLISTSRLILYYLLNTRRCAIDQVNWPFEKQVSLWGRWLKYLNTSKPFVCANLTISTNWCRSQRWEVNYTSKESQNWLLLLSSSIINRMTSKMIPVHMFQVGNLD